MRARPASLLAWSQRRLRSSKQLCRLILGRMPRPRRTRGFFAYKRSNQQLQLKPGIPSPIEIQVPLRPNQASGLKSHCSVHGALQAASDQSVRRRRVSCCSRNLVGECVLCAGIQPSHTSVPSRANITLRAQPSQCDTLGPQMITQHQSMQGPPTFNSSRCGAQNVKRD